MSVWRPPCSRGGVLARSWRDGVPEYVQCQVQHQLAVTGKAAADVGVLLCGQEFRMYRIDRDDGLIELERRFGITSRRIPRRLRMGRHPCARQTGIHSICLPPVPTAAPVSDQTAPRAYAVHQPLPSAAQDCN